MVLTVCLGSIKVRTLCPFLLKNNVGVHEHDTPAWSIFEAVNQMRRQEHEEAAARGCDPPVLLPPVLSPHRLQEAEARARYLVSNSSHLRTVGR